MADINIIAENLAELLTNSVDMAAVFYDIFLNPTPMDVSLKMFDDNNQLITVVIPNRAKDRVVPYTGEGSPEGVVEAPLGSTYIDTLSSTVYYKVSGNDQYGWNAVLSQSLMELFIRTYLEARGYVTTSFLSTYLYNSVTEGAIPSFSQDIPPTSIEATNEAFGVVKLDNTTITANSNSQISTVGITDSNSGVTRTLWVGDETDYKNIYQGGDLDVNAIYILKDTGQVLIGDEEIACNGFPSSTNETLTLGTSGDTYTAPANGWFILSKTAGVADAYLTITNNQSLYRDDVFMPSTGSVGSVACPALKGETVTITYSATGATTRFRFVNAASNRVDYNP